MDNFGDCFGFLGSYSLVKWDSQWCGRFLMCGCLKRLGKGGSGGLGIRGESHGHYGMDGRWTHFVFALGRCTRGDRVS